MQKLLLTAFLALPLSAIGAEAAFQIPSDPKATYQILERGKAGANPTLLYKRTGPSGVSYSKRVFDCKNRTTKYLGNGDTLQELKTSTPEPKMYPLVDGSIADGLWARACR
jgi:hypothetical protein